MRTDDAGGADDGDSISAAHLASCPIGRSRWTSARLSWNAACSAWTAFGTASERITHEILIGEVEIISMLIPSSASVSNTVAATPGCDRIPAPMIETLPISGSVSIAAMPSSARIGSSAPRRRAGHRSRS